MVFSTVSRRGHFRGRSPDVTVAYIGTPHVLHHRNAKNALLLELIKIAKEMSRLFMGAVWPRLQPIAYAVEEVIKCELRRFARL
ncbi:uncharacterized protein IAS62_006491 [Cryptococcus decagattii]|uniref:Uncharacterized protein n=1 Tax=Cryptococcus decagattii TaxID=1859122 RepID=A0ABZ2B2Q9_9TREE